MRVRTHFNSTNVHQTPTKINKQGTIENSKESGGYTKFNNTEVCSPQLVKDIIIETIKSRQCYHRDRGWDGWMASLTPWTWLWASSGSWWWTGKPGLLQHASPQGHRVRHGWATKLGAVTLTHVLFILTIGLMEEVALEPTLEKHEGGIGKERERSMRSRTSAWYQIVSLLKDE